MVVNFMDCRLSFSTLTRCRFTYAHRYSDNQWFNVSRPVGANFSSSFRDTMKKLSREGGRELTMVFTSDHGEAFREHNRKIRFHSSNIGFTNVAVDYSHNPACGLHDECIRVMMVLDTGDLSLPPSLYMDTTEQEHTRSRPRLRVAPRFRHSPTAHVDVMPTLLDIVELSPRPSVSRYSSGVSWMERTETPIPEENYSSVHPSGVRGNQTRVKR